MRNDSLDSLFSPHSIALVGASTKLGSVGNDIAKNLLHGGFIGEVFPVNPNATELYGTQCIRFQYVEEHLPREELFMGEPVWERIVGHPRQLGDHP